MRTLFNTLAILFMLNCCPATAADEDVVIKALVDEMERSKTCLKTGPHPTPYFVSYRVKEIDEAVLTSCLGAEPDVQRSRTRMITPTIRIGDYDLDSSLPSTTQSYPVTQITVDDDYEAIRRAAWLASDRAYTFAVTTFEWKKAYLSRVSIPNRLPDMSHEKPALSIAPMKKLAFDEARWRSTLKRLSAKFQKYPSLQSSKVSFIARVVTTWIVNSEGTRVRESRPIYGVRVYAETQAPDGMQITDNDVEMGTDASQLPSDSDLERMVERLASNLQATQRAPILEEYCGPVLFKGQAAAELIEQVLAPNFGLTQEDLADQEKWRNPLKNAIGRRVLPDYIDLIDNPQMEKFGSTVLIGGYNFDDDGVPAQKLTLVKNGKVNDVCTSRIPTRTSKASNGHSMGGLGVYNILELSSSKTVSEDEMKERMVSLAKDAGLDYVLVIERMSDSFHMDEQPNVKDKTYTYDTPSYSATPDDPTIAYRLYLDGRKEYVRGLEFNSISLRAFRDIQAVGNDSGAYVCECRDLRPRHLITPSLLIGELELRPEKAEHAALPVVPGPLTEK